MAKGKPIVKAIGDGRRMKRYPLPKGCSVREFVMRELVVSDRIEIARWVDMKLSPDERSDLMRVMETRQTEARRRALVEVDGVRVDQGPVPYLDMDDWNERTEFYLVRAFNDLNGVDADETKKFDAAAEEVTSLAPATTSEEASDDESTDE